MTKAVQQAKKPDADKKTIINHLDTVKAIIGNVGAASGLVASVASAILAVQKLF